MALVPSRQFYTTSFFDSFQSTLSKFHGTNILFFSYAPSISFRKLSSCSAPERDPVRKSNFASINQPNSKPIPKDSLSRSSWIDKWKISSKLSQPKPPRDALDYSDSESGNMRSCGGSTMEKIVEKLKKYGYVEDEYGGKEEKPERVIEKGSVEDIFYIEEGMLPNTRGGFSAESPFGVENVFGADSEVRFPWEKTKEKGKVEEGSVSRKTKSLAELTLPESEFRRLRNLTFKKKHKTRIGGGGVTQAVVDTIHEKWKTTEIVRLKIDGVPGLNMKRMHEILERKTGGMVIWRSGTSLSLYRGVSYKVPKIQLNKHVYNRDNISSTLPAVVDESSEDRSELASDSNVDMPMEKSESSSSHEKKSIEHKPEVKYEDEIDELLDTLGPRYADWSGCDPLPVDANRLQAIVPGYQPPFRILPYGVRASLGSKEATALKRLARVLPPHFALGRSRQLQGLALAITKLWEKSSVAIIALKRGVQLTTSERMAEEIKKLTGGILLYRNKDFLVFYRGKNFLSRDVTEALLEREKLANTLQDEEEKARLRASAMVVPRDEMVEQSGTAGTLGETLDADAKWGKRLDIHHKEKVMQEAARMRHAKLVHKLENKLAFAERKMMKAEYALAKVEESLTPAELQADPTSITDEERFMFRKLGLRMKAFLLLGRRGVFDGTVENMHLHWKYRELVKIMVNAKTFEQVKKIALALEAESGGVLVSVDKVSKKFAIIMYRGKDYQRPSTLRPKNLLTKRKALARSIELQRQEALLKHISALQSRVEKLRSELEQMDIVKDQGDETLYDILDSSYPSEDESEEEVDDAHLDIYDNENQNSVYSINKGVGAFYDKLVSYSTEDEESEDEGAEAYTKMYGSQNDDGDERDDSNHSLHLESQDLNSEFPEKQNLVGVSNDSWLKAPRQ